MDDQLTIAGKTFRYSEKGAEGLAGLAGAGLAGLELDPDGGGDTLAGWHDGGLLGMDRGRTRW